MENENSTQYFSFFHRFGARSRWFLAELIVIVVGVLIALAIDQWRGKIENVGLEQEYLRQLAADLRATEESMAVAISVNAIGEEAARQLLDAFETGKPAELDTIRQLLTDINSLDTPVPVLGTAEALISTGDLRLVRNAELRSKITQYLARSRDYWLVPIYQFEERNRELCFRITMLAEKHGVSPSHRRGQLRDLNEPEPGSNVLAFLADSEAYSHAARLVDHRILLTRFRSAMSAEAADLRQAFE